jgi:hypothetical protein
VPKLCEPEIGREHIIALEPLDNGLMGTLLRYPYEVRDEKECFDEIQDVKVTKDMCRRFPLACRQSGLVGDRLITIPE